MLRNFWVVKSSVSLPSIFPSVTSNRWRRYVYLRGTWPKYSSFRRLTSWSTSIPFPNLVVAHSRGLRINNIRRCSHISKIVDFLSRLRSRPCIMIREPLGPKRPWNPNQVSAENTKTLFPWKPRTPPELPYGHQVNKCHSSFRVLGSYQSY